MQPQAPSRNFGHHTQVFSQIKIHQKYLVKNLNLKYQNFVFDKKSVKIIVEQPLFNSNKLNQAKINLLR